MAARHEDEAPVPLFETKVARGGAAHKLYCLTILSGIVLIWAYRLIHIPGAGEAGRYAWIGMLFAEVCFGLYWIITQSGRWHVVFRCPFKDRLSRNEEMLPGVDVFVCTADPVLEPPSMVMSTVLSVMSYNYPSHKISVYLSDDGGSLVTFYALLEASRFAKYWIPFSKKYNVEPRSPEVYFSENVGVKESDFVREWNNVKELYEDMKTRIDSVAATGNVPKQVMDQHKGFSEWTTSKFTKQDHHSIVQILTEGWDLESTDVVGNRLPTLVYVSREKRPGCPHNFKAGAMNALLRVSAEISNAPFILNVDCDMYANDPDAMIAALCFFLDEKKGRKIAFVQYPQRYNNIVKNDVYANISSAIYEVELCGLDGLGGALYVGTGCFHRRDSLLGKKYLESCGIESHVLKDNTKGKNAHELEETSNLLANCSYEKGTQWGKEMGLLYGCAVEDILTGLAIHCRGWEPVYCNPRKYAFQGVAPTTLDVSLIQFMRWAGGMFHVFFSKYCPFIYGYGKISFGLQMGYCIYLLWAPMSLPTLCYVIILPLSLLRDVLLFPEMGSLWFIPFAYVLAAKTTYSVVEDIINGNTLRGWWNLQRMLMMRRTTSFLFGFVNNITRVLGLSQTAFTITAKVSDDEAHKRYEKGMMEFGNSSLMLIIIATLALLNLFGLAWGIKNALFGSYLLPPQLLICGVMVMLNMPVYEGLFFRSDQGSIPFSVTLNSIAVASIACLVSVLQ